jgi:hypothetical protein
MAEPITLTRGATTLTPFDVLGWDSTREARTVLHQPIDNPVPEVTAREAAPRSGTLRLFFAEQVDAVAAEDAHALPGPWLLTDPDGGYRPMRYVVVGPVRLSSTSDDGSRWIVEVGYQEVPA